MNETDCLFTIDGRKKEDICHYGIKGQKWGERHYQNKDGSLTPAGRQRYSKSGTNTSKTSSSSSSRSGLKKRIPGLKQEKDSVSVTKNGSKLSLRNTATDVSDADFENTYKNLDKIKKQVIAQLKKSNVALGKESPEAFNKTSDFNITIFNKKNSVCGVYVQGTGKSRYISGEFDLFTEKEPLQFK